MLTFLCLIDFRSPVSIFTAFLSAAWVYSSIPIVSVYLVVACCRKILKMSATYLIPWVRKTDPLSYKD